MKLAVPSPRVRFIVHATCITPVVGGVFPPEHASVVRNVYEEAANEAWPSIRDEIDRQHEAWIHRMIYGHPGVAEPRGLMHV